MDAILLHNHEEFADLLRIVADKEGIDPVLVEKDYWIMQVLSGLKKQGFTFAMKGGTSLSKGYQLINRFSEDIDILIEPPAAYVAPVNPTGQKTSHDQSRKDFYDWLSKNIHIDGITHIIRDTEFDDVVHYRSGGIRLFYQTHFGSLEGVKDGILLEAGFSKVAPNEPRLISSWAFEHAQTAPNLTLIDNRAIDVHCYHPGYTFVEKLQTIIKNFRQETEKGTKEKNYMRQYNDINSLLETPIVQEFITTPEYQEHKKNWIKGGDAATPVHEHPAFLFTDASLMEDFANRYTATKNLYYRGQEPFDKIIGNIRAHLHKL